MIGYDARHNSDVFARDTAEVMTGAGLTALRAAPPAAHADPRLRDPRARLRRRRDGDRQPQPAARQRLQGLPRRRQPDRAAGRRRDRRPDRGRRAGRRRPARSRRQGPRARRSSTATSTPSPGWSSDGPRDLEIVYTPLHGVGGVPVERVLEAAGFDAPSVVEQQEQPDPDFPTVAFPNPEEPGAMDLAMALAERNGADLVVANDPDADRCAAAVPGPHGWRMLRGDEVGALLAHALLRDGQAGHLRLQHRLLEPAREAGGRGRPAVRRDAHRLQVDQQGRRPRLRLRGGARLLRRPRQRARTRTASRRCCCSASSPPRPRPRAAPWSTSSTTSRSPTACTPPTSSRCGSPTSARSRPRWRGCAPLPRPSSAGCAVEAVDDLALGSAELPPTDGLRYRLADGARVDRAPERHRAEAQVLPRGRRAGRPGGRRRRRPDRGRRPPGRAAQRHQGRRRASETQGQATSQTTNASTSSGAAGELRPGPGAPYARPAPAAPASRSRTPWRSRASCARCRSGSRRTPGALGSDAGARPAAPRRGP